MHTSKKGPLKSAAFPTVKPGPQTSGEDFGSDGVGRGGFLIVVDARFATGFLFVFLGLPEVGISSVGIHSVGGTLGGVLIKGAIDEFEGMKVAGRIVADGIIVGKRGTTVLTVVDLLRHQRNAPTTMPMRARTAIRIPIHIPH